MNTKIYYIHRDNENYKCGYDVVVRGELTDEQKASILDSLDAGEFDPALVGFPCWDAPCELEPNGFEATADEPTLDVDANELVAMFQAHKGKWATEEEPSKPEHQPTRRGRGKKAAPKKKKEEDTAIRHFWNHYGIPHPLMFVELPDLDDENILELLRLFDSWYGDTEQETTEWALEFQLLTRMLISSRALLTNPSFLAIDNEMFYTIGEHLSDEDYQTYKKEFTRDEKEVRKLYRKAEKLQ